MRYHWGFGVGHLHAHQSTPSCVPREPREIDAPYDPIPEQLPGGGDTRTTDIENDSDYELDDESDDPEMVLEDRELEGWDESDDPDNGDEDGSDDDEE
jgi:hypothetical protein